MAYAAENVAAMPVRLAVSLPVAAVALFLLGGSHVTHDPLLLALFPSASITGPEMATRVVDRAIQVFGGYGYMTEQQVECDLRDSVGSTLYSGTSEIQRNIIARGLGL